VTADKASDDPDDGPSPEQIAHSLRALFDAARETYGFGLLMILEEHAPGAGAILTAWGAEQSLEAVTRTVGRRVNTTILLDGDRRDITVIGVET
jgi:hypothetical protein